VANIAEGYRKRQYPLAFAKKIADADGEATETQVWLDCARDCGYLEEQSHGAFVAGYVEIGKMLAAMIAFPEKFGSTN